MEPDWERKQRTSSLIAQVLTTIVRLYLPGRQLSRCGKLSGATAVSFARVGQTPWCHTRPSNEAALEGVHHRFKSIMRSQFLVDVMKMITERLWTDAERFGNSRGCGTHRKHSKDF